MKNLFWKKFKNPEFIIQLFFYLFLIFLPFGYRRLIYHYPYYYQFDEYHSVFIYLNDFFLLGFLIAAGIFLKKYLFKLKSRLLIPLYLFVLVAAFSVFESPAPFLAAYNFLRLFLAIMLAILVSYLLKTKILSFDKIFGIISALGAFEGLIAFGQFLKQGSLGLKFFGESVLEYQTPVIARISVENAKILRAYGTFLHPNILAAFLVLAGLSYLYFYFKKEESDVLKISLLSVGLFFNSMGLILTFSRSGWLAAAVSFIFVLAFAFYKKEYRRLAAKALVILMAMAFLLVVIFGWAIFPRSYISLQETAFKDRLVYNRVGESLIKEHPFGVGIGNQVIRGAEENLYQKFGIKQTSRWQPIHNFYFLILVELGILGFIFFLVFIGQIIFEALKKIKSWDAKYLISFSFILALFVLGFFDHYLWDLEAGRLMFWLSIGIMMGV